MRTWIVFAFHCGTSNATSIADCMVSPGGSEAEGHLGRLCVAPEKVCDPHHTSSSRNASPRRIINLRGADNVASRGQVLVSRLIGMWELRSSKLTISTFLKHWQMFSSLSISVTDWADANLEPKTALNNRNTIELQVSTSSTGAR